MVAGSGRAHFGRGAGRRAGYAKGGANVTLAAEGGGTTLSYEVDAAVGGKIAQLGSRIIDGFAKNMADQFFRQFANRGRARRRRVRCEGDAEADRKRAGSSGWSAERTMMDIGRRDHDESDDDGERQVRFVPKPKVGRCCLLICGRGWVLRGRMLGVTRRSVGLVLCMLTGLR